MGKVIEGVLQLLAVVVVVGGIGTIVFFVATALSGGTTKPNPGSQSSANVHVNVQVAAPQPAPFDPGMLQAQAMQAALYAQQAHAALYGQPAYRQPVAAADYYDQLPQAHAPAGDQAAIDRAVEAALQRRAALPSGGER